jgi:hypothetical protein
MNSDPIGGSGRGQGGSNLLRVEPYLLFKRPTSRDNKLAGRTRMLAFEMVGAVIFMLFFGALVTNGRSVSR